MNRISDLLTNYSANKNIVCVTHSIKNWQSIQVVCANNNPCAAAGGSVEAGRQDLNFAAASPAIPKGHPNHRVLLFSPRTAARWISQGIAAAADLETVATAVSKGRAATACARYCLQSRLNVNAMSAWLGHSSLIVTLNTYLVLAPDTLEDSRPRRQGNPFAAR